MLRIRRKNKILLCGQRQEKKCCDKRHLRHNRRACYGHGSLTFSFKIVSAFDFSDLMLCALEEVKKIVYNDLSISASNKNKEIVSLLYQRGIFNLKDY